MWIVKRALFKKKIFLWWLKRNGMNSSYYFKRFHKMRLGLFWCKQCCCFFYQDLLCLMCFKMLASLYHGVIKGRRSNSKGGSKGQSDTPNARKQCPTRSYALSRTCQPDARTILNIAISSWQLLDHNKTVELYFAIPTHLFCINDLLRIYRE